jgi:trigger factor
MATVTREPIGKLHDKLVVKITKEDYLPSFESALKLYGKSVNVPGFRKGNVPVGMVRKMYGQSVFLDEVLRTANRELETYLKEERPEIFAQPIALPAEGLKFDMNQPSEFSFEFEIGLKPEFEVTPLIDKKGAITHYEIAVDDKMLDAEIDNLKRRAGKVENPDVLELDTDIVYADYIKVDANGNEIAGAEKHSDVVTLESMPKKLAEQLKGKKAEDTITFVPADVCSDEEIAAFMKDALKEDATSEEAKSASYKLVLTKVGRLIPRELNEDFYAEVFTNGDVKDEATFRERIREELKKQTARLGIDRLQNEIFETLVHETPIELPVAFLKNWLKKGGEKEKTDEEVEAEYSSFDHQLRWTLISDKLVREYKIEVKYDEVMADIRNRVATYFGVQAGDDTSWLDSYLERMAKDEKAIDETYRRLLFDRLFEKIADVMEVTKAEISEEEFSKLPTAHHHH